MKHLLLFLVLAFLMHAPVKAQQKLPAQLLGNWLSPKSNAWQYGFTPHYAVADGKFWSYAIVKQKKNSLELLLKNKDSQRKVYVSFTRDKNVKIGATEKDAVTYTQTRTDAPDYAHYDTTGFKLPIIKPANFYLSGVLNGYNPRQDNYKYAQVIYNPLLEDNQKVYAVELDSLGRFTTEFPLLNPQEIMFKYGNDMASFFAVPGSSVLMQININRETSPNHIKTFLAKLQSRPDILFMGTEGMLNTEINDFAYNLNKIFHFFMDEDQRKQLDQQAYGNFRLDIMEKQLSYLRSYTRQHQAGKRFLQQQEQAITYHAAEDLLRYSWLKDPKKVPLTDEYLAFRELLSLNNPLNVITDHYSAFIKQTGYAAYANGPRKPNFQSISITAVIDSAKRAGFKFEPADEAFLKDKELKKATLSKADTLKIKSVVDKYSAVIQEVFSSIANYQQDKYQYAALHKIAGTDQPSFSKDIFTARLVNRTFSRNEVLTEKELARLQRDIQTPEILTALKQQNDNLKNQLAGSFPTTANVINPLKTNGSQVLESLINKYAGKVVYVDFWAPWCGPCMSEMPNTKVLKKEMAGKDVVFLYLGVECAEDSWQKTIKKNAIEGEHYLLSKDEYALLSQQFQISGIPRYMLIDKTGKVANADAERPSEQTALIREINLLLK